MLHDNLPILNYIEGQRLRDEGIITATSGQEDWLSRAKAVAEHIAATTGEVNINDIYAKIGLPDRPNVAGAIFRGGKFRCVGVNNSARVKRRCGLIRRWALV